MPFYIRSIPRRPFWHAAVLGAAVMLIWATAQAVLLPSAASAARPGALARALYVLGTTAIGGGVAGGLHWALGTAPIRDNTALRIVLGTLGAGLYLTTMTVAATVALPLGPWSRLGRPSFLLSTSGISLVLGWLIAKDPFGLSQRSARVYLTPADFGKLSAAEQERLRLDSSQTQDPPKAGGAA